MALVHGLTSGIVRGLVRGLIIANGVSLPVIANGDFATNDLTGWTEIPSGGGTISASSGALSVVSAVGENIGVEQIVTGFVPGVTYNIEMDSTVASGRATVLVYNNTVASGATALNTTVFNTGAQTRSFTPTVSDCLIRINRWSSGLVNQFTLDNIRITLA